MRIALINYRPLESYANRSVQLAVLSPGECATDIWRHLNELNKHHATTLKQDKAFLPEYIGFQDIFRCGLNIPNGDDTKRFMGKSSALELVNEILMLTKMNWNSGDGLYKILPVTLDFAKALSRVAKQDLVVYDRPYDFRYFM